MILALLLISSLPSFSADHGDELGAQCIQDAGSTQDLSMLQLTASAQKSKKSTQDMIIDFEPFFLLKPAGPDEEYNLHEHKQSYSQVGQDLTLLPILSKVGKGFFVESGAAEGEAGSNTLMYEQHYNWTGLLIEPNPLAVSAIKSHHRRAYLYEGCLSPTDHAMNISMVTEKRIQHTQIGKVTSEGQGSIEVKAQPLQALLEKIDQKTVDFWSLDIEGAEGAVLTNTDFSKIEVGVMLIEMDKHDDANEKVIWDVMRKEGFVNIGYTNCKHGVLDRIFVNPKYFQKRSLPVPTSEVLAPENRN